MSHSHSIKEYPWQVMGVMALGASIGAFTAMVLTPRTGVQVRNDLKQKGEVLKTRLKSNTKQTMAKNQNNVKKGAAEAKKTAEKIADDIRRNGEP